MAHFGFVKRRLQWLGSVVVRMLSGTEVRDAVSGLRAIARDAAIELNVYSDFSYTIETLIQAGQRRQRMVSVPIRTNGPTRPSRLFRSLPQFLIRSGSTMVRSFRIGAETTVGFLANHWSEQPKKIPSP